MKNMIMEVSEPISLKTLKAFGLKLKEFHAFRLKVLLQTARS